MDGGPRAASRAGQGSWRQGNGLTQSERYVLQKAKSEHQETTQAARRAQKIAEETVDVARGSLVELHRQGQQLEKAELGVEQIDEDVKEASVIIKFMRRWCCIQLLCCCDCCDPTLKQDRTRKKRVQARRHDAAYAADGIAMQYGAKQQAVDRIMRQADAAYNGDEDAARGELLRSTRDKYRAPKATDIGWGLPEEDRQEIARETELQDRTLDQVDYAVQSLKAMSLGMQEELTRQEPQIHRLQDRAAAAHDQIGGLTRKARRI